jgi:chaperonin GroES
MIRPLIDYVLVQVEKEHQTAAGLVVFSAKGIRDSQSQYGHRGTVLAVGPGRKDKRGRIQPTTVKPGDLVRFGEFQFKELDGNQVLIQEADITGIEE